MCGPRIHIARKKLFHDRWNTQELVLLFYGMKQFYGKKKRQVSQVNCSMTTRNKLVDKDLSSRLLKQHFWVGW